MSTVFVDDRKREFLNCEGADRPLRSPLPATTLDRARRHRRRRLVDQVAAAGCGALLLYDPINIRYVLDLSNQQLWATHNAFHYALVFADGHVIDYEYAGQEHVAHAVGTADEIRPAISWFYFVAGEDSAAAVERWADGLVAALRERGVTDLPLAVDRLDAPGADALVRRGVSLTPGQRAAERARAIKNDAEIDLMAWTIRVAEAGMARMYEASEPGRTEQEIWAELHHENIRSGGEWLETRLLCAGPRTNPWFHECSDRVCTEGDMLAFDTDMIGPYGYCADLSRSWTIGHTRMTPAQRDLYEHARDQVEHNVALLRPGLSFVDFDAQSWRIPDRFTAQRYMTCVHGVGLCDEYPFISTHLDFTCAYDPGGYFEENMVVCVESYIGEMGALEGVKLESQVLLTASGPRKLDHFPYEDLALA